LTFIRSSAVICASAAHKRKHIIDSNATCLKFASLRIYQPGFPIALPASQHFTRIAQDEERRIAGSRWQETGFVFTTSIGTPMDARGVIRRFHSILNATGLPRIRFHDLRHSAATLLLAQGVSPRYISDLPALLQNRSSAM
jgi:integrase